MGLNTLLRLGYAAVALQGALSVVLPRRAIAVATTGWRATFENVGDLEPREWYVEMTRVAGIGMLVAGLAGLLVTGRDRTDDTDGDPGDGSGDRGDGPETGDGGRSRDDGPISVTVDE